jgi:hypothetical protein
MGYSCEENFHHTFHILRNMIWVLMSGTEKLGLSLEVWRHDGEPVNVGQNGSSSGTYRSGTAYILDPVDYSVCLPYIQHSVLYPQNYI